jgi:hypothetical protein
MKKIEVTCIGCGKKHEIVSEEGHTGIVKCDCGATTSAKGDVSAIIDAIAKVMEKAPALMREMKQSRRKGFETGIDEALHETVKVLAGEILKEDLELREDLKEAVRGCLSQALHPEGGEDNGPEVPER